HRLGIVATAFVTHEGMLSLIKSLRKIGAGLPQCFLYSVASLCRNVRIECPPGEQQLAANFRRPLERARVRVFPEHAIMDTGTIKTDSSAHVWLQCGAKR